MRNIFSPKASHDITCYLLLVTCSSAASAPIPCKHRISGSISLPYPGFFSPFPHGTVRYRSSYLFSLGWWSTQIPTGLHVSDRTWEQAPKSQPGFVYGAVTLFGRPFQDVLLPGCSFVPTGRSEMTCPTTPRQQRLPSWHWRGLGCSPFARHY